MIGFFKENDRESIIDLWRRTFNDCEDYINNYINAFSENIIVCRLDGVVIGMVSLLDICVGEHKGGYIYALAVDEGYRKQGIATCILEFAQEKMLNEGCEFSVVVPEPYNYLERFYKNLGFNYELPLYKSVVLPNHSTEQVNITPVNKDEYYRIRKTQLGVVVHSKKIFEYVYEDLISDGFQKLKSI